MFIVILKHNPVQNWCYLHSWAIKNYLYFSFWRQRTISFTNYYLFNRIGFHIISWMGKLKWPVRQIYISYLLWSFCGYCTFDLYIGWSFNFNNYSCTIFFNSHMPFWKIKFYINFLTLNCTVGNLVGQLLAKSKFLNLCIIIIIKEKRQIRIHICHKPTPTAKAGKQCF